MQLVKASRKKVKLKLNLGGPAGFGKTTSALLIAYGMTNNWDKIAVIDSENDSASLYANHRLPNGFVIGEFQTISVGAPYTVDKFCQAIQMCVDNGIEVAIIDSMYHYWKGQGGILEYVQNLGGRYQDWAKGDPQYMKMLNGILLSPIHIITTTRKKQAYEITENDKGKKSVEKKGMEDELRNGYEYELTVSFDLISDKHMCKPSKDRSGLFMHRQEFIITPEIGRELKEWCESGKEPNKLKMSDEQFKKALERIEKGEVELRKKIEETFDLTDDQTNKIKKALENLKHA